MSTHNNCQELHEYRALSRLIDIIEYLQTIDPHMSMKHVQLWLRVASASFKGASIAELGRVSENKNNVLRFKQRFSSLGLIVIERDFSEPHNCKLKLSPRGHYALNHLEELITKTNQRGI